MDIDMNKDIDMNMDKIMDTKIDRVQQMIKVQNEALELFRKKKY